MINVLLDINSLTALLSREEKFAGPFDLAMLGLLLVVEGRVVVGFFVLCLVVMLLITFDHLLRLFLLRSSSSESSCDSWRRLLL